MSLKSRGKRSVPKCLCTSGTSAANPSRLPPELNTFSCVEPSTTQRTPSSSRADSKASISSLSSWFESALRVSGRFMEIRATPSRTS